MTESPRLGHSAVVPEVSAEVWASSRAASAEVPEATILELYQEHFHFVWRSLRRLGVPYDSLDDATQEVFLVAHRRLADFEGRSSLKTWLFAIALRVARRAARTRARRPTEPLPEVVLDVNGLDPQESAMRAQAVRQLYETLDSLSSEKRGTFVMAELEQMTALEIAEVESIPVNTVYSRLRAARADFDKALARLRAREAAGEPR
jgi:RNA polymerase sigma-70 factor (ECF subfamily)